MTETAQQRNKIFISYAHQDRVFVERMKLFLEDLEPSFPGFEVWIDRSDMDSGDKWFVKIDAALAGARVAVLLFSHDFLFSSFIKTHELPRLMQAAESDGVALLPVIVAGGSRFKEHPLNAYNAINLGRELKTLDDAARDEVYTELQAAVRRRLQQAVAPARPPAAAAPAAAARAAPAPIAPAPAAPRPATAPAMPLVPGLQPALAALLDVDDDIVGVDVMALDANGDGITLFTLDMAEDEISVTLSDAETLAPLQLSAEARARLADDRYGSNRVLGQRERLSVDGLKAEVGRLVAGVFGLPNAHHTVTAEGYAEDDEPLVADLADNINELLNPKRKGAWMLEVLATDGNDESSTLMWLARNDEGTVFCTLANNDELPGDLAIARATRQALRAEGYAPDVDDERRDSITLGEVSDLDPGDVHAGSEADLKSAYGLPRDDYTLSSTLSRSDA